MSGSTRSYETARHLVAAGHRVDIITTWRDATDKRGWYLTNEDGIWVHWLPVRYSNYQSYAQRIGAFLKFAVAAARRAASIPADVVFASSTPLTIVLPAIYARWRSRIPMVFEVRDLWPEVPIAMGALRSPLTRWLARRLEKLAYSSSAAIIALSPDMKAGVVASGVDAARISVVPNGSDLFLSSESTQDARSRIRNQLGIGANDIVLLYAGTLGQVNDVGYLVEVAAALPHGSNIKILVVGDGRETERVQLMAREHGVLGRNFFMCGRVPKSAMAGYLSAGDIVVSTVLPIPALEANCANKVFDGLAAGKCIAINHGGWLEALLLENRVGVRLSQNLDHAAATLLALAAEPDWVREAGLRASALARTRFSRDALAKQVELVLDGVVRASR